MVEVIVEIKQDGKCIKIHPKMRIKERKDIARIHRYRRPASPANPTNQPTKQASTQPASQSNVGGLNIKQYQGNIRTNLRHTYTHKHTYIQVCNTDRTALNF